MAHRVCRINQPTMVNFLPFFLDFSFSFPQFTKPSQLIWSNEPKREGIHLKLYFIFNLNEPPVQLNHYDNISCLMISISSHKLCIIMLRFIWNKIININLEILQALALEEGVLIWFSSQEVLQHFCCIQGSSWTPKRSIIPYQLREG